MSMAAKVLPAGIYTELAVDFTNKAFTAVEAVFSCASVDFG